MNPNPQQLLLDAREHYRKKNYSRALAHCRTLLDRFGPNADALTLEALIHLNTGKLAEAGEAITEALARNPDHAGMLCTAALISRKLGKRELARQQALKSVRHATDNVKILCQSAMVLGAIGETELALQQLEKFVDKNPQQAEPWHLIGKFQTDLGNTEAAEYALRRSIALSPGDAMVLKQLVRITRPGLDDAEIVRPLEKIIQKGGQGANATVATFTLADIHRTAGEYEKAFELYRQANANRFAAHHYYPSAMEDYTRMVIAGSTAVGLRSSTEEVEGPGFVFITGMPRSGTTLCEQVVSAHSRVYGCGELNKLGIIEQQLQEEGIDLNLDVGRRAAGEKLIDQARAEYRKALPGDHESYQWLTDKSIFNFRRLGFLHRLFPTARMLWVVRHPLDTILSCFFRDFKSGGEFTTSLDNLAHVYVDQVRIMRHWQQVLPGIIHTVRYPDLVKDLEATAHGIADFLALDFEPAMLEPHKNPRAVKTASNLQVRRPVYDTAIDVWKNYEQQLQPTIAHLQEQGILDDNVELKI